MPALLGGYAAVIVPGFFAENAPALIAQIETTWQPVIARLRALSDETLVAASCYGTFVLGESGLLDGINATTTWWLQDQFRQRFPRVHLDADQALADGGRCLTAGAMTAHTELTLHVLRRLYGAALARQVGAIMLVDGAKTSQRPFMTLRKNFDDPLIQQAADWLATRAAQALIDANARRRATRKLPHLAPPLPGSGRNGAARLRAGPARRAGQGAAREHAPERRTDRRPGRLQRRLGLPSAVCQARRAEPGAVPATLPTRVSGPPLKNRIFFAMHTVITPHSFPASPTDSPLAASCQLLLVVADDWASTTACLHRFECAAPGAEWSPVDDAIEVSLGRSGLAWGIGLHRTVGTDSPRKREGDRRAPAGAFAITALFGNVDHQLARSAKLPYLAETRELKAIDDPASRHYNTIVEQSTLAEIDWNSHEDMLRADGRYAIGAVVAHNSPRPIPGAGSCIFIHVWQSQGVPTAGCTAGALADIEKLCAWLDGASSPVLVQLPRAEYARRRAAWALPAA